MNAEFQRIARRDKKTFLSDQCKQTEENNRMGKTRDFFKKIRDTKEKFLAKMGIIKDRHGMDLTEAEDIKERWQKYTEELYKKDLHDPDNHNSVITHLLLLLLLLSRFSCVRLCVTPWMAAHQAPPSLGFSRQEQWSGVPFPSLMHESESEVAQLCPTISDPMECSLPGSSVHGIFQARVLEWVAIAFSEDHSPRERHTGM